MSSRYDRQHDAIWRAADEAMLLLVLLFMSSIPIVAFPALLLNSMVGFVIGLVVYVIWLPIGWHLLYGRYRRALDRVRDIQ